MRTRWILGAVLALGASAARAGDEVHVVAGPLAVDEGVTIAGRVFVYGDSSEKPLTVRLVRRNPLGPNAWSGGGVLETKVTDGDAYRFEGLVPGTFDLTASGDGIATTTVKVSAFMGTVEATLHPPLACTLRVKVALAFEGSLEDAWVDVVGQDGITHGGGRPENGVVEVTDLAPGKWWVSAEHAAGGDRFFAEKLRETSVRVDLEEGTKTLDLTIPESADVRLTARSARAGEAFEGVVRCRELPTWQVEAPFRVASAADGAVSIAGMRSHGFGLQWQSPANDLDLRGFSKGTYTLTIDALGFAPWEQSIAVGADAKVAAVLAPQPGRYLTIVDESIPRNRGALQVDVRPASGGPWKTLMAFDDNRPSDSGDAPTPRAFLPPGRYEVSAVRDDVAPSAPQAIEVTDDRSTLSLSFEHPTGHTLHGRTTTRAGDAVGSVLAYVFVRDGDAWRALTTKAAVSAEGEFTVRGLAAGRYRLAYDAGGAFPMGEFDFGDEDASRAFVVTGRPAVATDGGTPEHVVLGLLPAEEGYSVAGTVVGGGTSPVYLQLGRAETDPVCQHGIDWSWRTVELRPGERFRFVGLPPGHYILWTDVVGTVSRRIEAFDLFADREGHRFRMPFACVKGRIKPTFQTGSKRMFIDLRAVDGSGSTSIETAPGAEFATSPLVPGRYAAEMWWMQDTSCPWTEPHRWTFVDVGEDGATLDYEFAPWANARLAVRADGRAETFEGKVLDLDLPDDAAFRFGVQSDGGKTLGTCVLQESAFGAALGAPRALAPFGNLTCGKHRLRFRAPGFEDLDRIVDVVDAKTTIDVALKPIPGTFVVAEGPGRIFEVFARLEGEAAWRGLFFGDNRNVPTHTNPDRPRELLAPGKWEFMATSGDLAPSAIKSIELGADHEELVLALECVPGHTLHGTLKTPSGVALEDEETYVFVQDGDTWRRLRAKAPLIDARGAFEIRGLAAGRYRLAFDDAVKHAFGEFEVADADVTKDFVFRAR